MLNWSFENAFSTLKIKLFKIVGIILPYFIFTNLSVRGEHLLRYSALQVFKYNESCKIITNALIIILFVCIYEK